MSATASLPVESPDSCYCSLRGLFLSVDIQSPHTPVNVPWKYPTPSIPLLMLPLLMSSLNFCYVILVPCTPVAAPYEFPVLLLLHISSLYSCFFLWIPCASVTSHKFFYSCYCSLWVLFATVTIYHFTVFLFNMSFLCLFYDSSVYSVTARYDFLVLLLCDISSLYSCYCSVSFPSPLVLLYDTDLPPLLVVLLHKNPLTARSYIFPELVLR